MVDTVSTFVRAVKLVLRREFPDLGTPYRYPSRARVVKVQGNKADLQLLGLDGSPLPDVPVLPGVDIPDRLNEIAKGEIVRVGFEYNDPGRPFILDRIP